MSATVLAKFVAGLLAGIKILKIANRYEIICYQGSENNVIERFYKAINYFENNPEIMSESDYKKIHRHFAENFFATEKKPFTTIPSAFKAVDDLRNEHSENTSKMSQLDEINSYILELQKFCWKMYLIN